jgi:hypothetical protein
MKNKNNGLHDESQGFFWDWMIYFQRVQMKKNISVKRINNRQIIYNLAGNTL